MAGGYAIRVEAKFLVGALDLIIKLPDPLPVVLAEGKVIHGYKFGPSERQCLEGGRIQRSGMLALLLGWKERQMYISPWTKQADCRDCYFGVFDGTNKVSTYAEILRNFLEKRR